MPTSRRLEPETVAPPRRKVDLARAVLIEGDEFQPVQYLAIHEPKGPGGLFTPHVEMSLLFQSLIYEPPGKYRKQYHLLAGDLPEHTRLRRMAMRIRIVPAYAWALSEVVLMPLKCTSPGEDLYLRLACLLPQFPRYRVNTQWDAPAWRYAVYSHDLTPEDQKTIAGVVWPTKDEIIDALLPHAYDDIELLAKENEDVRTMLAGKEVE